MKGVAYCPHCLGVDVAFDALVEWQVATQTYVVTDYDHGYCATCDTEIEPEFRSADTNSFEVVLPGFNGATDHLVLCVKCTAIEIVQLRWPGAQVHPMPPSYATLYDDFLEY